jgi:SOS response regulatory protein OraA/RecX
MGWGVGETYSEAEALYVVNHVDADWKAEAAEDARNRLEDQGHSRESLMWHLTKADGFSKAEATYAVSRIERDWNAEAVEVAKETLEAKALSKDQLIRKLKRGGFTAAQVRYAVEKVS